MPQYSLSSPFKRISIYKAWSVHAFTASGVILALMALLALINQNPGSCLLWLGTAMMVDGLDGTLARKYEVKNVLPHFDGSTLDMVVDYLTWSFIPAIFIYFFVPLPHHLELFAVAIILLSSMFCYCNINMKSQDNYFVGFPAAWNIIAAYFYILALSPWLTFSLIIILALLTLTKMKFLHPFRVRHLMPLNIIVTLVWCLCTAYLIVITPQVANWVMLIWWLASFYFIAICFWRTLKG